MSTDTRPSLVQSISYATPAARAPRRWFSLRTVLLALLIVAVVQIGFMLESVLHQIFTYYHFKLPEITQLWIDAAALWNAWYGWVVAWPIVAGLSISITLLRRRPLPGTERGKWLLFANLAFLAINVMFVVTIIAAYLPMIPLIEDMRNSGVNK